MSAMGDLRVLLLEHGVNYDEYGGGYTHWNYGGESYTAQRNIIGKLIVCNLTPEQAIDATLGRGECRRVMDSIDLFNTWVCDHCGHPLDASDNFCCGCGWKVKQ